MYNLCDFSSVGHSDIWDGHNDVWFQDSKSVLKKDGIIEDEYSIPNPFQLTSTEKDPCNLIQSRPTHTGTFSLDSDEDSLENLAKTLIDPHKVNPIGSSRPTEESKYTPADDHSYARVVKDSDSSEFDPYEGLLDEELYVEASSSGYQSIVPSCDVTESEPEGPVIKSSPKRKGIRRSSRQSSAVSIKQAATSILMNQPPLKRQKTENSAETNLDHEVKFRSAKCAPKAIKNNTRAKKNNTRANKNNTRAVKNNTRANKNNTRAVKNNTKAVKNNTLDKAIFFGTNALNSNANSVKNNKAMAIKSNAKPLKSKAKAIKSEAQRTNHNLKEQMRRQAISCQMNFLKLVVPVEYYEVHTEMARSKASKQKVLNASLNCISQLRKDKGMCRAHHKRFHTKQVRFNMELSDLLDKIRRQSLLTPARPAHAEYW